MWISVLDKLPESNQIVLVKLKGNDTPGIAQYINHFGFGAEDSAYNICADDDSGLQVTLNGSVEYWMAIPALPQS